MVQAAKEENGSTEIALMHRIYSGNLYCIEKEMEEEMFEKIIIRNRKKNRSITGNEKWLTVDKTVPVYCNRPLATTIKGLIIARTNKEKMPFLFM